MYSRLSNNLLNGSKFRTKAIIIAKQSSEATIQIKSDYMLHNLDKGPSCSTVLKKEDAKRYFIDMDRIRRFENSCAQMYRQKIIRGFCHLYAGQEAVGVGVFSALRPQDICITAYRVHGLAYLLGAKIVEVLSELTGRTSGNARGKGGSMHMYTNRLFGGNGIVGAHIPVGTGIGLALKKMGKEAVSVTLYGDGAANQGQCFEAFNMAKIWKLPVIYICENNLYGLGTAASRVAANNKFYTRCEYIPGIYVNGMDVLAVREAVRYAIDWIKSGNGPIILECMTYRYFGHSMSDPGTSYRTREEVDEVRQNKDCIKIFKDYLISSKLFSEEELKTIEKENKKLVDEATEFSKTDKIPPVQEIHSDIYINALESIRNVNYMKPLPHILSKK